jgi:hypothetical protein
MPKLILLPEEIRLIKGLIKHTCFNDQQITAIFSHLDRNINHREIGSIRANNLKYQGQPTADADEINALLSRYRRLQGLARRIGVNPSSDNDLRVEKAVELMKSAVTVYNNCTIGFRTEIFIVNALIAWTYVLHAYFIKRLINPIYLENNALKLTADGEEKFWDLSECLKAKDLPLTLGETNNLKYLLLLRHVIEHRLARDIDDAVQAKVQACAINFSEFCAKHFGEEYNLKYELDFAIQFVKLTLKSPNLQNASSSIPSVIQTVNKLMEDSMSEADYNDLKYAFRVYVVPKTTNNPKKADQAVTFAPTGSEIEMAIKLVERPKHRAGEIVNMIKAAGYKEFVLQTFIEFWKAKDLKNPKKGFAIQLGGQWFWYPEVIAIIRKQLDEQVAKAN